MSNEFEKAKQEIISKFEKHLTNAYKLLGTCLEKSETLEKYYENIFNELDAITPSDIKELKPPALPMCETCNYFKPNDGLFECDKSKDEPYLPIINGVRLRNIYTTWGCSKHSNYEVK